MLPGRAEVRQTTDTAAALHQRQHTNGQVEL